MIKYHPIKINILVAMAKKGFNQKLLGIESGLDPSTLSNFLNGRYGISSTSARKIAAVLDCDLEELFEFEIKETDQG